MQSTGRVLAEALGGAPGEGDTNRVAAGVTLGLGGRFEHDAFAGPGGADEHRDALRAGQDPQRVLLLGGKRGADPLAGHGPAVIAGPVADIDGGAGSGQALGGGVDEPFGATDLPGGVAPVGQLEQTR